MHLTFTKIDLISDHKGNLNKLIQSFFHSANICGASTM